ncbi:uncharacterized protein LOC129592640 [Paramacrobiotus metropolitanus]|uniref:uncharacterized protein LOC129592640 n=1 Tax=Paramacrobiotus metropolitanus TaxID=2943436 RepID=UPI0024461B24|nr:uncharacterized protein LOC129592640 [Paramacrobiotus metropolitanus]
MQPTGWVCGHCGCSWEKHLHIAYETYEVERKDVDQNVMKLLRQRDGEIYAAQKFMKALELRKNQLQLEEVEMRKVAAKFGCFLKNNAMLLYNDAMEDYLSHLISAEKEKIAAGITKDRLECYERMLREYRAEKALLETAMRSGDKNQPIAIQDVNAAIQSLYTLPLSGQKIRDAVDTMQKVRNQQVQHQEKVCMPQVTNTRRKPKASTGGRRSRRFTPYHVVRRGRGTHPKMFAGCLRKCGVPWSVSAFNRGEEGCLYRELIDLYYRCIPSVF